MLKFAHLVWLSVTSIPGETRSSRLRFGDDSARDLDQRSAERRLGYEFAMCLARPYGVELPDACEAAGSFRPLSKSALTATSRLEPDIDSAAISGRSTSPNEGSKTPAAMGMAIAL